MIVAASALCGAALAQDAATIPAPVASTIAQLQARALASDHAMDIVTDLVTEIGPRIAGSPAEARARDWAVAMLRREGFANVHIEPFQIQSWDATVERAEIIGPVQQPLSVVALGGSPPTPAEGLEGDVVRVTSLDDLAQTPDAQIAGKIVFVDEHMTAAQDGSGYGIAVAKRGLCAARAQAKGAIACIIRSAGTNATRFAHQGGRARQNENGHLPVMALAPPDADVLARIIASGRTPRLRLHIESQFFDNAPCGNVIAEIPGRERPNEIIVIAAHLDSWDAGQGAIDDGAGVAIITAAAKLIQDLPRHPRRTIRILFAGAEENNGGGYAAYFATHGQDAHILTAESDFGAGRVWRVRTRFNDFSQQYIAPLQRVLAPLGVLPGDNDADGGADIEPLKDAGVATIDLGQDGTHYFDIHHTADDTLHNIDPADMRQNVAAWASMLYLFAETDWAPQGIPKAE